MAKTYTFSHVEWFNKTLRAIPKEASASLRDAAQVIAGDIATEAAGRARSLGGVAKLVAPTIRPGRDRIPKVLMGGSAKLPGQRGPNMSNQTVGNVWGGAEWESRRFTQFPPVSQTGRFLFATVRDQQDEIMDRYGDALMTAVDKAAR